MDIVKDLSTKNSREVCSAVSTLRSLGFNNIATNIFIMYYRISDHIEEEYLLQLLEELTITVYYTDHKCMGNSICEFLLSRRPNTINKQRMLNNRIFYANPIRRDDVVVLQPPSRRIAGTEEYYRSCNPSIIRTKDGYMVNVRRVNYDQKGGINFTIYSPDGAVRTENTILKMDKNMTIQSFHDIEDNTGRNKYMGKIRGIEDIRLFLHDGRVKFLCTVIDNNDRCWPEMGCGVIEDGEWDDKISMEKLTIYKGPVKGRCEKNWVPYVVKGKLKLLYKSYPAIVYDVNGENINSDIVSTAQYKWDDVRGGTPPIDFMGGLLLVTHEVVIHAGRRRYLHRLIHYTDGFKSVNASLPFVFEMPEIEFCLGMCISHEATHIIMSVGVEDSSARLYNVPIDAVVSMLAEGRGVRNKNNAEGLLELLGSDIL